MKSQMTKETSIAMAFGAKRLLPILVHGRLQSEVNDYIKHILGDPDTSTYVAKSDVVSEKLGVEEALMWLKEHDCRNVGNAGSIMMELAEDDTPPPPEDMSSPTPAKKKKSNG